MANQNGSARGIIFPIILAVSSLALYLSSIYSYLLFHSLVELFSVVIAFGIFVVAWGSRRYIDNNFLLILGIGYLFIGGLELAHTLSYKGMNIFRGYDTNLPTQLWVATRYLEAVSFAAALLFLRARPHKGPGVATKKADMIFFTYSAIFILILLSIFWWKVFPTAYQEGAGLTIFKKVSEYIIALLFLTSVGLLVKKRKMLSGEMTGLLSLALIVKIASEISFTEYASVYGFANTLGHLFMFISFLLIYKAVLEIGLMNPYGLLFLNLKKREEKYRIVADFTHDWEYWIGVDGRFRYNSPSCEAITGYTLKEFESDPALITRIVHPKDRERVIRHLSQVAEGADTQEMQFRIIRKDGQECWIGHVCQPVFDLQGLLLGRRASNRDITMTVKAEQEVLRSRQDLDRAEAVGHIGWWRLDTIKNKLTWSDENHRIFGIQKGTPMTYETFLSCIHPDDRKYIDAKWKEGLIGKPYDIEHRIIADKQVKWVREKAYLEFDDKGKLLGGFGITQDITERKLAEEKLAYLASFPLLNTNPIVEMEKDLKVSFMNPAAEKLFPKLKEEGLNNKLLAGMEHIKGDASREIDLGHSAWIQKITILRDGRIRLYFTDITDRKLAEEKLAKAQMELKRRTEEQLVESYKHLGVINRRISLLLEIEKHSQSVKNKQEISEYILASAVNLARAKIGLLYKFNGGDEFGLVTGKGYGIKGNKNLRTVSFDQAEFSKKLISGKARLNGPRELFDAGCLNLGNKLNYCVVLPLFREKHCRGFIFLGFSKRKSMDVQELEFLDVFAMHASTALTRAGVLK